MTGKFGQRGLGRDGAGTWKGDICRPQRAWDTVVQGSVLRATGARRAFNRGATVSSVEDCQAALYCVVFGASWHRWTELHILNSPSSPSPNAGLSLQPTSCNREEDLRVKEHPTHTPVIHTEKPPSASTSSWKQNPKETSHSTL